jgi:D-glycero-beta-D-manno-heptose 1-phosphate adenylyltransferase
MSRRDVDISHWPLRKLVSFKQAAVLAAQLKEQGKKLVTTNGSFDLLHAGHLNFLGEAKAQGDVLFVGVNSDRSVAGEKGKSRPFVGEQERAGLLAALVYTDYVFIVDELYNEVPNVLIRTIKPHIHVNGSEYGEPETWVEWPTMQEVGARGYVVKRRRGLATSNLVKKIIDSKGS